jgi:hypothetical protein
MFTYTRILAGWLGVLGVSTLIALPADSQNSPINRGNTSPTPTFVNEPIIRVNPGNLNGTGLSYPYGSRIGSSGAITSPQGQLTYPTVQINHGNGSTTYYYPNGTRITVDRTKLPATGGVLR